MYPNKRLFLFLIFFLLVFGCSAPASLATPTQVPDNTPIPSEKPPVVSDTPVASPVPPTPVAALTSGPYLAYLDKLGTKTVIKFMDGAGKVQTGTSYPSNAAPSNESLRLDQVLSPDGKWLAYYSGSAGGCFASVGTDTADLTLNLMSLADGTARALTPLLSNNYPNNFVKAARELGLADVSADMLQNAFVCGITQSLAWSPDGRYLAFAGQMDGLSSDLYLYDSVSNTIQRLSSGSEEVGWITWSPDGKWILDGSTYSYGEGMQYNIYATSVDGAVIKRLSNGTPSIVTSTSWLDEHSYFDTNGGNGPGAYDLKLVDVNSGKTASIWKGSYSQSVFVPYGHWVALYANTPTWPYTGADFQTGVFLVDTATLGQTRVNSMGVWGCCAPPSFVALGHSDARLFLVNVEPGSQVEYLSAAGKLSSTKLPADKISVSPDRLKWIAISARIQIFSEAGTPIRTVDLPANLHAENIGSIYWWPDSSVLFFIYQDAPAQLYTLDLAKGGPVQVATLASFAPANFFLVGGSR